MPNRPFITGHHDMDRAAVFLDDLPLGTVVLDAMGGPWIPSPAARGRGRRYWLGPGGSEPRTSAELTLMLSFPTNPAEAVIWQPHARFAATWKQEWILAGHPDSDRLPPREDEQSALDWYWANKHTHPDVHVIQRDTVLHFPWRPESAEVTVHE